MLRGLAKLGAFLLMRKYAGMDKVKVSAKRAVNRNSTILSKPSGLVFTRRWIQIHHKITTAVITVNINLGILKFYNIN